MLLMLISSMIRLIPEQNFMIMRIIIVFIVLAIGATIAYQMGWLSDKGENAYDETKESIIDNSEKLIDKADDAMK